MADKYALIVADVQNDFLPGGALGVEGGDRVVPVLNEYMRRFHEAGVALLISRDWHPPVTVHFNTQGGPWPPHCIQGTPGAEFASGLSIPPGAFIVSKGVDPDENGYSCFDAQGAHGETFDSLLRRLGVTHLYLGGIATDYCVLATALDALRAGYRVSVLEDAVTGVDDEESQRALSAMVRAGAKLVNLRTLPALAEEKESGA